MIATITPKELAEKLNAESGLDLIDVRTPVEFREVHATPARNIPLDKFDAKVYLDGRNGSAGQAVYVICRSGNRAKKACEQLEAAGLESVVNVEGGTQAWEAAGLPVVRGKKTISLERQVRIVAGFLVFVGAMLAIFVHPYFAGIAAFIGAGLMFAGITDTCGMGMMLAKMPWNQVRECADDKQACKK